MQIAAFAEAFGRAAEAAAWYFKYKIFSATPERRRKLQTDCENLEDEIRSYRTKIKNTDSVVVADFYNDICDGLRVRLARRRRELEYLSKLGLAHCGKDRNTHA